MRLRLLACSLVVAAIALAGTPARFAYVYKRGDETTMRINGSLDKYLHLAKRWTGEFIWVDRGGRQYLIRDAAVLAEARKAFAEMEALEPALRAAEEKVRPIEEKYEALEEQMDDLSDREDQDAATEAKLREMEERLRPIEKEMRVAEAAMERLEDEMDRLEEIAEAKFEKIVIRAIDSGKAQRVE